MQESTSRERKERNSSTPSQPWYTDKVLKFPKSNTSLNIADFNFQVADFGGTLGVFIGFSFITVWDGIVVLGVALAKIKVFFLD